MVVPVRARDVVWVGADASVQFAGDRGIWFRVIRVLDRSTWQGWVWLDGYELIGGPGGPALERRTIYVQPAGLHRPAGNGRKRPPPPGQGSGGRSGTA